MRIRVLVVCATAALLSGCGYVGDPLPPALNTPEAVTDVRAVQRADKVVIEFTAPALTVEALPIKVFREVDVRVGPIPANFSMEAWAAQAKQAPATAEPGKPVRTEVSVAEWVGREVLVATRLANTKGRPTDWMGRVTLTVSKPLAPPAAVAAAPHAEGVRVSWKPTEGALSYRVYREKEEGKERALLGESAKPEFIDRSVTLGRPASYSVVATAATAESEPSEIATVTPRDVFAPGTPTGLMTAAGIDSIELTWERRTEPDLRNYRVYRAEESGEFVLVADAVEGPSYSDRQITAGKKYRYQVTAVDQSGNESARSPVMEIAAP